jgi:hypothetical protein
MLSISKVGWCLTIILNKLKLSLFKAFTGIGTKGQQVAKTTHSPNVVPLLFTAGFRNSLAKIAIAAPYYFGI